MTNYFLTWYVNAQQTTKKVSILLDYDFQTALMEALCRMASSKQRKELADQWFTMEHVANAFIKISDTEFETVKSGNRRKCINIHLNC